MNRQEFEYTKISSASDTQIFTGRGLLHTVVVNTTAAGAINLTDAILTASSGTSGTVGILQASVLPGTFLYDISIANGLTVATAAGSNITVCWAKG